MSACKPLSRARFDKSMMSADAKLIATAAAESRKKYLAFLSSIFERIRLREVDEILVLGGTGNYLLPIVQKIWGTLVRSPDEIYQQVEEVLGVERDSAIRLADGFAVADMLKAA